MHQATLAGYADREKQADRFASAFLMPQKGFAREFWSGGRVNWSKVFDLKRRWKVSAQAMIHRAYDLDLINAVEYRRAYKAISAKGWRKGEPEEPEAEHPELVKKAIATLWERKKIGAAQLAAQLHWPLGTFNEVTGLGTTHSPRQAMVFCHSTPCVSGNGKPRLRQVGNKETGGTVSL
jgi:hypothetical protein